MGGNRAAVGRRGVQPHPLDGGSKRGIEMGEDAVGGVRFRMEQALSLRVRQSQNLGARHSLRPSLDIQLGKNVLYM
jgi:hypothetical protein